MREAAFAPEDIISVPLANTAYACTITSAKPSSDKLFDIQVRMVTETETESDIPAH